MLPKYVYNIFILYNICLYCQYIHYFISKSLNITAYQSNALCNVNSVYDFCGGFYVYFTRYFCYCEESNGWKCNERFHWTLSYKHLLNHVIVAVILSPFPFLMCFMFTSASDGVNVWLCALGAFAWECNINGHRRLIGLSRVCLRNALVLRRGLIKIFTHIQQSNTQTLS